MADDIQRRTGRLALFGSASREAVLDVTPRPRSLRLRRALATGGLTLPAAVLAGLIPPHFPWALGVLGFGAWRARGEWRGEYRLHAFEGACPRCGNALKLDERYITPPLAVPCYGCHAQPQLTLE